MRSGVKRTDNRKDKKMHEFKFRISQVAFSIHSKNLGVEQFEVVISARNFDTALAIAHKHYPGIIKPIK